ncbi:GntR family transcriptional regulator [Phytoactinopolyspora endophytica]|uniref:GntR family transcriptional regulator n=1 Tax=Phytoactinopolyspora endophytica TaxID=1642495 RepID=UPI00101E1984|nr:GntR family transcriptional regulator [Phytoactinopolyspora endophytica]
MPDANLFPGTVAEPVPALPPLGEPVSRTDRVRDALRGAILDGTLPPGRPLVERELAEMLGVSKTPVREALKQLRSSGLVEVNVHQGVSVRRLDAALVRELYIARATVEPEACRLACLRGDAESLRRARQALEESAQYLARDDSARLSIANRRFHREIYAGCGNTFLCDFLDQLQDLTAFVATAGWRLRATAASEAGEHLAILEAAENGDADRTEDLSRQHIETSARNILELLEDES